MNYFGLKFTQPTMRTVFAIAAFIVLFASCDFNSSDEAMHLSAQIGAVNDSLTWYGKQWSDELKIAVNSKDFSELPGIRTRMQAFIDRNVADIKDMKDVGSSKDLREAELQLLYFDRDSVLPKFQTFESFNTSPNINAPGNENEYEDILSQAYSSLIYTLRGEESRLKKVYDLRDKYADDNDFPKPIDK